jgi:hypothetical protein
MDHYELIAAKRDEIFVLAARFGIKDIRIFGSVARHEARKGFLSAHLFLPMPRSSGNSLNFLAAMWMLHRLTESKKQSAIQ